MPFRKKAGGKQRIFKKPTLHKQQKSQFTVQRDRLGLVQTTRVSGLKGGELRASILHTNENKQYIVGGDGIRVELNEPGAGQIQISFDSSTTDFAELLVNSQFGGGSQPGPRGPQGLKGDTGLAGAAKDHRARKGSRVSRVKPDQQPSGQRVQRVQLARPDQRVIKVYKAQLAQQEQKQGMLCNFLARLIFYLLMNYISYQVAHLALGLHALSTILIC